MTDAERASAPATVMLSKADAASKIIKLGKGLGYSEEAVKTALIVVEQEGECIVRFCRALGKLEEVPGVEKCIKSIVQPFAKKFEFNNFRGAFYELDSALEVLERGEEVVALGVKVGSSIGSKEFDIITRTKLIECKNWNWSSFSKRPGFLQEKIKELKTLLGQKRIVANEAEKKLVLHSRYKLLEVSEFNELRKWLKEKGIELIEGLK